MKKGIYLLPTMITLSSMFCGFYSIVAAINGDYKKAALVLIAAAVFDILDGKIARLTNSVSQFGIEMDSLADLLSFGMAPALLIYLSKLQPLGKIGWMAGFLFVACGAMRLARHNVIAKTSSDKSFVGLPIPAAGGVIIAYTIFVNSPYVHFVDSFINNPTIVTLTVYILAFLMVSNFAYHGFKEFEMKRRMPFSILIMFVFIFFSIVAYYRFSLFIIGVVYMSSGPLEFLFKSIRNIIFSTKEKNKVTTNN